MSDNTPIQARIANQYLLQKQALEPEKDVKIKGSTPEDMVDLMAFSLAVHAYFKVVEAQPSLEDPKIASRSKQLSQQMFAGLDLSLETFIAPLIDRSDAAILKTAWNRARRAGSIQVKVLNIGEFIVTLMNWFRTHPQVLRDICAKGRAFTGARRLSQAALSEAPESILAQLAANPPVSRLRSPFKWISMASESAGLAPLPEQQEIVDGEAMAPIVDEIRATQSKLLATDPTSEDAADLQETKAQLEHELTRAIDTSKIPAAASQAAVSSLTQRPDLDIEQRYGANPEQARIILEEGKLVVSAGAGSGKTKTVVDKIEHTVRDLGYMPEQILITSFTNKAANELKERLEKRGIVGVRTGTTHSIAKEVVKNGRPDLNEQMNKGAQNGDTLFRLAIVQVGLNPRSSSRSYGGRYAAENEPDEMEEDTSTNITAAYGRGGYGRGGGRGGYGGAKTSYWKEPVGEWFNLGLNPRDGKGRPLGTRRLRTVVGLWQSSQVPVEQAWNEWKDAEETDPLRYFAAAAYGAYTWLKKHDPQYGPALDLDDWIPTAVKVLEEDDSYRASVQRRLRFVGVDESQDQNSSQHKLFAILGEKADTYMLIGDDSQSIYQFRGAEPQQFIELPNKGFKLLKITTNYRSGKSIVDAGNRLIAHNEDRQIPKVCQSDVERRGMGQIKAVETISHEDAAVYAANEIASSISPESTGGSDGTGMSPNDFGVLVRNNAEADAYCLALIVRGVPFKCKRDFFTAPAIKSMLAWMTIAVGSSGTSDEAINEAVAHAHMTPGFFLDKQFAAGLASTCPRGQNYLQFLIDGGGPYTGQNSWRNAKMVGPYADALREVAAMDSYDSISLVRKILELQGPKAKFIDSLLDNVDPDELLDESSGVDITDEQLREAALAPLQPLFKMAETFQDPAKFMEFIGRMARANTKTKKGTKEDPESNQEPAVMVGTVHSWKGLERPHVYVSMAGGTFPHHSSDEKSLAGDVTAYDEERRLAYVAITRGRDTVTIMSPEENYLGRKSTPSRFIDEACIGWEGAPPAPSLEDEEDADEEDQGQVRTATESKPMRLVYASELSFGADLIYSLWERESDPC